MPPNPPQLCPLPQRAFVSVQGADAQSFLHGQLSREIAGLGHSAPLAGWHDPNGRVRALVRVLTTQDGWLLVTHRETASALTSRLGGFVLRARVRVREANDAWQAAALLEPPAEWLAERAIALGAENDAAFDDGACRWVRIGPGLVHVFGPPAKIGALGSSLPGGAPELAALAEIRLGLPDLAPGLEGRYLPQMLNLDRLGAVTFTKGCYPGQEVIARARNLGSVKRRMQRFSASLAAAPEPGSSVLDGDGRAVGEVIRAVTLAEQAELLAVVQLDAAGQTLYCAAEPRIPLRAQPLPYPLTR